MHAAAELSLPNLPIQDPQFARDPIPYLDAARRQHPWLARCDFGYLVHEYQAIKDLNSMDSQLRPSMDSITQYMGATGTPWGQFMDELMLAKAAPEHTRLRSSVALSFSPRNANRFRPLMQAQISSLLDEWAPRGAFDFAEFASSFPIRVMFALIGASPDALPGIRRALETQGLSVSLDRSLLPALQSGFKALWDFVDEIIVARQRTSGGNPEDVLNTLIAANTNGTLNDAELRNLLIFLFAAGYDTSKNMLTLIAHMLLQHPDDWARCAVDRAYSDKVVEEVFRYNSVSNIYRTANEDVVYRDVLFPKDSVLILTLTLASRDPRAVPDANEFQPERNHVNRHLAFGRGMHMCLGQHVARAQIQEGIHLITQRLQHPRLAGEVTWRPFPGVWGIRSLPIRFEPATVQ
jgi:cytochrome P450